MPRYLYMCVECGVGMEAVHSYRERLTDCNACNTPGALRKDLSTPSKTRIKTPTRSKKVGEETRAAITDAKKEIIKSKKELKEKSRK